MSMCIPKHINGFWELKFGNENKQDWIHASIYIKAYLSTVCSIHPTANISSENKVIQIFTKIQSEWEEEFHIVLPMKRTINQQDNLDVDESDNTPN